MFILAGKKLPGEIFPRVHYYFSDHLGSASVVTDSSGAIQKESDYYPFGGEMVITGSDINNYKFTAKERDSETGLDYFGARYYGSSLGRFMTPDWAAKPVTVPYAHFGNPQSLNLYSYVVNNPTTTADPDGHCIPFCAITTAIANWALNGITRDGSVGAFAKNNGIGLAKGAGQVGVGLAAGLADKAVPGAAIQLSFTKTGQTAINAVTPSNQTQAQAAPVGAAIATTAVTMGVAAGVGALDSAMSGAEYFHYGYLADEANFAGGLRAGSFATTDGTLTGADAQSSLSLPHSTVPDAVYPVTPEPGTPVTGPTTVQPEFGQPGGGQQVQFPQVRGQGQ
jgi:RHS repeat-associated protein